MNSILYKYLGLINLCRNSENPRQSASWDCKPKGPMGPLGEQLNGKPHYDMDDGDGNDSRIDENGKPVSEEEAHPRVSSRRRL